MTAILKTIWQLFLLAGRLIVFIAIFLVAATNTQTVSFNWFPGLSAQIPLILLLLITFLLGIGIACAAFLLRGKRAKK